MTVLTKKTNQGQFYEKFHDKSEGDVAPTKAFAGFENINLTTELWNTLTNNTPPRLLTILNPCKSILNKRLFLLTILSLFCFNTILSTQSFGIHFFVKPAQAETVIREEISVPIGNKTMRQEGGEGPRQGRVEQNIINKMSLAERTDMLLQKIFQLNQEILKNSTIPAPKLDATEDAWDTYFLKVWAQIINDIDWDKYNPTKKTRGGGIGEDKNLILTPNDFCVMSKLTKCGFSSINIVGSRHFSNRLFFKKEITDTDKNQKVETEWKQTFPGAEIEITTMGSGGRTRASSNGKKTFQITMYLLGGRGVQSWVAKNLAPQFQPLVVNPDDAKRPGWKSSIPIRNRTFIFGDNVDDSTYLAKKLMFDEGHMYFSGKGPYVFTGINTLDANFVQVESLYAKFFQINNQNGNNPELDERYLSKHFPGPHTINNDFDRMLFFGKGKLGMVQRNPILTSAVPCEQEQQPNEKDDAYIKRISTCLVKKGNPAWVIGNNKQPNNSTSSDDVSDTPKIVSDTEGNSNTLYFFPPIEFKGIVQHDNVETKELFVLNPEKNALVLMPPITRMDLSADKRKPGTKPWEISRDIAILENQRDMTFRSNIHNGITLIFPKWASAIIDNKIDGNEKALTADYCADEVANLQTWNALLSYTVENKNNPLLSVQIRDFIAKGNNCVKPDIIDQTQYEKVVRMNRPNPEPDVMTPSAKINTNCYMLIRPSGQQAITTKNSRDIANLKLQKFRTENIVYVTIECSGYSEFSDWSECIPKKPGQMLKDGESFRRWYVAKCENPQCKAKDNYSGISDGPEIKPQSWKNTQDYGIVVSRDALNDIQALNDKMWRTCQCQLTKLKQSIPCTTPKFQTFSLPVHWWIHGNPHTNTVVYQGMKFMHGDVAKEILDEYGITADGYSWETMAAANYGVLYRATKETPMGANHLISMTWRPFWRDSELEDDIPANGIGFMPSCYGGYYRTLTWNLGESYGTAGPAGDCGGGNDKGQIIFNSFGRTMYYTGDHSGGGHFYTVPYGTTITEIKRIKK